MKIFKPPFCSQGDLNIWSVNDIPSELSGTSPSKDGNHVLAHSETGHHHVISDDSVTLYNQDEFISYLDVEKDSNVIHLRGFDTHETIQLPAGKYRLTRQREYTPEGYRRAAD